LRIVLLLPLAFAVFVSYTHSLPWTEARLPRVPGVSVPVFAVVHLLGSFLLAGAWGAVFAIPFAWGYRRFAWVAAALCTAPVVFTFVHALTQAAYGRGTRMLTGFQALCVVVLFPLLAWLASRWLQRRATRAAER